MRAPQGERSQMTPEGYDEMRTVRLLVEVPTQSGALPVELPRGRVRGLREIRHSHKVADQNMFLGDVAQAS
jgi:hypothetical protein